MESLKRVFHDNFLIGTSLMGTMPEAYSADERALLESQFDIVTPGWCMKSLPVQPEEGVYRFEQADALVEYTSTHNLLICAHTLVWHKSYPRWFFQDGEAFASRETILRRMETHIHTLAGRYRGKIFGWDVVNEAFDDEPEYLMDTPWASLVGDDFYLHAFAFARDADPDAQLYYNEWDLEKPTRRWKTLRLIDDLQSHGLRIDAVGIQGHWELDAIPFKEIDRAITEFHAAGVQVNISELDIDVVLPRFIDDLSGDQVKEQIGDPYADRCPPEILSRLAEQYAELFRLFRHHSAAIDRVTLWDLHDGRSWLNQFPYHRTNYPTLFDRQLQGKVAFQAVVAEAKA